MKKLIEKLRLWLISRLNAVPMDEFSQIFREAVHANEMLAAERAECQRIIARFQCAVREICRRSATTYYGWCCDVCCMHGESCRGDSWCRKFWPGKVKDDV